MDSLTQFALGAGVGLACLGRRLGPRRAALAGGVLGTLPDLDVFYPFGDPVDAFVLHRGASHSLIVQAAVTPVLGEGLVRLSAPLRDHRWLTWAAVYACLATHALLDALTIYGTRIFWPLWPDPVGVGSVFIIDPLYTLPLLVVVVWALCARVWTVRLRRGVTLALVASTAYLGWTLVGQQMALARAQRLLAERGIEADRLLATPTPFNSLLWRAIAIAGDRYANLYVPVLSPKDGGGIYLHERGTGALACAEGIPAARRLAAFSHGFYRIDVEDGRVILSDLRMGLTPAYAFRFEVGRIEDGRVVPVPPARVRTARATEGDLAWLAGAVAGQPVVRPAEAQAALAQDVALPMEDGAGPPEPVC